MDLATAFVSAQQVHVDEYLFFADMLTMFRSADLFVGLGKSTEVTDVLGHMTSRHTRLLEI